MRFLILAITMMSLFETAAAQIQGVSCCDWMMLKRQKLGEMQLTKDIGADGVEMDMGPLGKRVLFENRFRKPVNPAEDAMTAKEFTYDNEETRRFKSVADSLGVKVSSIAMSGFFAQSFLKRENYKDLILDCLNTMDAFGARVAFLPLGGSGKEWQEEGSEAYDSLVMRLHVVGEMAAKRGKVIGVRTAMPAAFGKRLMKKVASSGARIYYNVQDACDNGWDICKELQTLGAKNICQIHCSNTDGVTLRHDPEVNLLEIIRTLKKIKYKGWLTVERSRDAKDVKNVKGNYSDNVEYIKSRIKVSELNNTVVEIGKLTLQD